ncbi:carbohydrate-binding protein [Paenibacillus sp. JDR-2]|uniref:carbohydrate-binding protein n=1 Tax=Paenibacillus sp. (strain JDR-2) TaxID=324057 RepID=UPI0001AAF81F|nr:carbohydrate-binding protein [Paenibacillus sp. JDR-2]ACT01491.1 glycoside hydrolase family 43 [Paenibacillus sp. JDR-2]
MLKRMIMAILCALLLIAPQAAFAYKNPKSLPDEWGQYGLGDPYVMKFNGNYYLYVSTRDTDIGVKVWSSPDLVNWSYGGLAATDPVTKGAYAPEVVYWNGYFYMYTSPAGNGHYVLRSESPTGPFTVQTGNLGNSIDGNVFIDDDGKWYFYHANGAGILAAAMPTPTTIGNSVNTGASMDGWTEGSTLFKRNGKYYMTYTGNHVFSKGYRVDYAVSTNPLTGFVRDTDNPILISTEGPTVGLGHNTVVVGPNLDARYIIYHNLEGPGIIGPLRHMGMDRIVFNGDKMSVLGPTATEQPDPEMPDFEDRFNGAELSPAWTNTDGSGWSVDSGLLRQQAAGTSRLVTTAAAEDNYTAEFNLQLAESSNAESPQLGVVFSRKGDNDFGTALLDPASNSVRTQFRVNGVDLGWISSTLPEGYDYTKLHNIRVEKSGDTFKIYVDGMLKQTRNVMLGGGSIGYVTENAKANFGYAAFSNDVNGSSDFDAAKPVPGQVEAVHYLSGGEGVGYHDQTPVTIGDYRGEGVDTDKADDGTSHITAFEKGEWLQYRLNIAEAGKYDIDLSYADAVLGSKVQLTLDGGQPLGEFESAGNTDAADTGWQTAQLNGVALPAGVHILKVTALSGTVSMDKLTFHKHVDVPVLYDNFDDGQDDGWKRYEGFWSVKSDIAEEEQAYDAYHPIPGTIGTVHYISGGEGVGYHENTLENIGGQYRGDSVDIRSNPVGGGYNVGWNQTGEWLKFNIDVAEAGSYNAEFKVATTLDGGQIRLWLDDTTDLTGIVDIPKTGDWNIWNVVRKSGVTLPAGKHTLKAETVRGEFDFAGIALTRMDQPIPVPGVIEAEHYKTGGEGVGYHDLTPANIGGKYRNDQVDIRSAASGDQIVGWNQTGEWLKYNIHVAEEGLYDLDLWAATTFTDAQVRLWLDDTTDLTGTLSVPASGDWNKWKSVTKSGIQLPAGDHELKVEIVKGEFDMTRLSLTQFDKPHVLPGFIQAADYKAGGEGTGYHDLTPANIGTEYRNEAVDIRRNAGGSYNVGWNATGEWLAYNVDIAQAGVYNVDFVTATSMDGAKVRLWLDDATDLSGEVDIPSSVTWENWATTTKQGIYLPAGEHTLKVETVKGEFDFQGIRIHQNPVESKVAHTGEYQAAVGSFAKTTIGDANWSDYSVESDIKLINDSGDGGILFRANNPAHGKELNQNNANFVQGYVAYLNKQGVHLGKLNYNWTYLTGVPLEIKTGEWKHVKVVAQGARILVYVDDMSKPVIDYTDRSGNPFTHGKVGMRTFMNETSYDNFTVLPAPINAPAVGKLLDWFSSAGQLDEKTRKQLDKELEHAADAVSKKKPDWKQGIKHLDNLLKQLNKEKKQEMVSDQAKTTLNRSVNALIEAWSSNLGK